MATPVSLAAGAVVVSSVASDNTTMYTPQSITAAVALTSVFPPQTHLKQLATRFDGKTAPMVGILVFSLYIEGTVTSRFRQDGISPTAAVGDLIAAAPIIVIFRGWDQMSRTIIIGTAAGNLVTGSISCEDIRM